MKKFFGWIIISWFVFNLFLWTSFWYLEKTAYCDVNSNYIKVYLYQQEHTNKCSDYIYSLDSSIRSVYANIMTVQQLIDRGYDTAYWSGVKGDLQNKLQSFQSLRTMILDRVRIFENNFFSKVKMSMERHLLLYQQHLEAKLDTIEKRDVNDFSTGMIEEASKLVLSIQNQLVIIQNILATQNLDELISYIPSYIYLKKEIEWK